MRRSEVVEPQIAVRATVETMSKTRKAKSVRVTAFLLPIPSRSSERGIGF
jgi:hypothetical protein